MEINIGQMAYMGDVWYQVMDKRHGKNELSGAVGMEYKLYSKDYWVPSSWIKDVKNKGERK